MTWSVIEGDMRDADFGNGFDAVFCDPPYELGFMGKRWDASGVAFDSRVWARVLAACKPGAPLLAFGGTRTYHRMACAIEDAGFEIRDCLAWLYGSGFPKSVDVSKALDKRRDDGEDVRRVCRFLRAAMDAQQITTAQLGLIILGKPSTMAEHWAAHDTNSQPTLPTGEQWLRLKQELHLGDEMDDEVRRLNGRKSEPGDAWKQAEVIGAHKTMPPGLVGRKFSRRDGLIRAPSAVASAWAGYGTALKPAFEPCVLARVPLAGTVAENVTAHGCGALAIDAARLGRDCDDALGRWPANVLLDEQAAAMLDAQTGALASGTRAAGEYGMMGYGENGIKTMPGISGDTGGPSRFFYTSKASRADRDHGLLSKRNPHPTVKPSDLTEYLARLILPPRRATPRRLLVPFAGSGSEMIGALRAGWDEVVGVELIYFDLARERITSADTAHQRELFGAA